MNNVNMNNTDEKRLEISAFLESLIDQYKNRLLSQEQEMRITEFYMKECFLSKNSNESNGSNMSNELNDSNDSNELNDSNDSNDSVKYLVMGWYVYEQFIKKNNL